MKRKTDEFQMMSENQRQKLESEVLSFASHQTNVVSKILNPHRYDTGNSIYGQNSIVALWNDSAYDTKTWPDYQRPVLIMKETNPVEDFYEPLLVKMRTDYFSHAFKKHGYKSWDEFKQTPQFDISKLCNQSKSFKSIQFDTDTNISQSAKEYGMDIFTPCLSEYVIKVDKNHALLVKLLDKDEINDIYNVEFHDYLLDKRDVVCVNRINLWIQYDRVNNSIEWDAESYISYEDFLTQDIPDMNWSAKEERFWKDVFGVDTQNESIEVSCPFAFDEADRLLVSKSKDENTTLVLSNQSVVDFLQKTLRQFGLPEIAILNRGESVSNEARHKKITQTYPHYLTAIALVNLILVQNKQTVILPEDATVIKVGALTVKTQNPLRLNLKL